MIFSSFNCRISSFFVVITSHSFCRHNKNYEIFILSRDILLQVPKLYETSFSSYIIIISQSCQYIFVHLVYKPYIFLLSLHISFIISNGNAYFRLLGASSIRIFALYLIVYNFKFLSKFGMNLFFLYTIIAFLHFYLHFYCKLHKISLYCFRECFVNFRIS